MIDSLACACIYTSGSASPRQYKHTPNKTELKKQTKQKLKGKGKAQIELNKIRRRAKWGFALSRLRKHPLSR